MTIPTKEAPTIRIRLLMDNLEHALIGRGDKREWLIR